MLPDWIELCALLDAHRVEYLLVGGHAVIAHGYARLTKDMDLWVRPTEENGVRVLAALAAFGTPLPDFDLSRFLDSETMLVLGADPFRVDILTGLPGVEFESAWQRRSSVTLDGVLVPLISRDDLILNKRTVARVQDLADVHALESLARPDDD